MAKLSPLMQQFFSIKEEYGDYILLFRVGDFYEMFYDDAHTVSKELDLTLTGKSCGQETRAPMCGVPYHSCDTYIAKLVQKGYKVAICEQVTDPATSKGLVEREVVRVITPGTVSDGGMLPEDKNNFLACIVEQEGKGSVCFADISTGEIQMTFFDTDFENLSCNELCKFMPSEVLASGDLLVRYPKLKEYISVKIGALITTMDEIKPEDMADSICKHFSIQSVQQIGLEERFDQLYCLYYLLFYIKQTQKCNIEYLDHIDVYSNTQYMQLDITARRNLELVEGMRTGDHKGSLFSVLNKTKSAMGKRMLISFLERPLLSVVEINRRLDAVENLNLEPILRSQIRDQLYKIYDLERLITRVMYRRANPRDLLALKQTFETLPHIRNAISVFSAQKLKMIYSNIDELQDLYELIERSIREEASTVMRDGGYIKPGYNETLDEYTLLLEDNKTVIEQMQEKERERTGIKNLKISYNRVFGYYIEVTRAYFDKIPEDYIRKQTLTDKERMITPELKDLEYRILSAKDKKVVLEQQLFDELLDKIAASYYRIRTTASALAELDVFCSFSQIATEQNYVKPDLTEGDELQIVEGRHPVVECNLKDSLFVPNDINLNASDRRIMIITGPNMGGKSTYMRQVAIITVMAQIGCFVPAKSARIGIVDKIFTRVGASDDLSSGESTFMVEMKEVAYILNNATPKSLLILDEIGRGTSTLDGMSIAQSVVEYLSQKKNLRAKAMFATHYHELCALENTLDGIVNFNVTVKKRGEQVIFLKKIVPGGADNSYGLEVAALAGIPKPVVNRAREILETLSLEHPMPEKANKIPEPQEQVSLMDFSAQQICDELKMLDVSTLTPIEAISKLYELSNKAKQEN